MSNDTPIISTKELKEKITKDTKTILTTPKNISRKEVDGEVVVTVEATYKKTKNEYIRKLLSNISNTDKAIFKQWYLTLLCDASFVLQGLVGLLTLTLYRPRFSTKVSTYLAVQSAVVRLAKEERANELKADDDVTKVESKDTVVLTPDEWLKKFREGA